MISFKKGSIGFDEFLFSVEEVELAEKYGFVAISLGEARLRTETAALVACHSVQFLEM